MKKKRKPTKVSVLFSLTQHYSQVPVMLMGESTNPFKYSEAKRLKHQPIVALIITFTVLIKEEQRHKYDHLATESTIFIFHEKCTLRESAAMCQSLFNDVVRPDYEGKMDTQDIEDVHLRIAYTMP